MCKVVAFTNASKLDVKKASEVIGNILLKIESDGFGYAVKGDQNTFGEKCIADRFTSRLKATNLVKLPIIETRQETFGVADKPTGPAIFHGRTSTNDKGLLNCHPMIRDGWHLIHNGVVNDSGPKYFKHTTNDSEDLLQRLILGIEHVERDLTGYYAFCALDPMGRLHVGRDSIATLFIAWSTSIQSHIIATTEDLIEEICETLKIKVGPIDKIKDNCYLIFDGNGLIHNQLIKPRGYDSRQAEWSHKSLGYEIHSVEKQYLNDYFNDDGEAFEDRMRELDNIDDRYTIIDENGDLITAHEYHQLDEISKAQCIIEREDGTVIEPLRKYA